MHLTFDSFNTAIGFQFRVFIEINISLLLQLFVLGVHFKRANDMYFDFCWNYYFLQCASNDMRWPQFCLLSKWLFPLQCAVCAACMGDFSAKKTAPFAFQFQLEIIIHCTIVLSYVLSYCTVYHSNQNFNTTLNTSLSWLFPLQCNARCLHGRLFCKMTAAFAFQFQLDIIIHCTNALSMSTDTALYDSNQNCNTAQNTLLRCCTYIGSPGMHCNSL